MKFNRGSAWQKVGRVSRTLVLMALLAMLGTGMVWAQSTGTFTPTGNMITARTGHTATLLRGGKVLIAGGSRERPASAELYDPSTRTFTASGDMTTARSRHTATLLADDRVLLVGGSWTTASTPTVLPDGRLFYPPIPTASAELYDPFTGTFSATGDPIDAQAFHAATLLTNGKVLIAGGTGGETSCCPTVARAELYDPSIGTFTATGGYADTGAGSVYGTAGLVGVTSTLLANGKVLIAAEPTAELYDPVTGTFSFTGEMTTRPYGEKPGYIAGRTATLLTNGKVLVTGGEHEDLGRFASAELYDPSTGAFTATSDMIMPRDVHTATLIPDGTVLIAGGEGWGDIGFGCCGFTGSLASAELYDPSTGASSSIGNMTARRSSHVATLLNDGRVLITGGLYYGGIGIFFGSLASVELYVPPLLVPAPVLLSLSGDGQGQGAILHGGTARLASPSNPAIVGEALEIYCTGLIDGAVIPPQVAIGGRMAEILFFGKAPGFAGVSQVNVRVPSGVTPGPAVPVRLTYLGRTSNEVTIVVR